MCYYLIYSLFITPDIEWFYYFLYFLDAYCLSCQLKHGQNNFIFLFQEKKMLTESY